MTLHKELEFDRIDLRIVCRLFLWFLAAAVVYGASNFGLLGSYAVVRSAGNMLFATIAGVVALLSIFTLLTGVFQWSTWVSVLAGVLLSASLSTNLTSEYVSKSSVSRADVVWMWAEADRLQDVILVFGRKAAIPLVASFVSIAFIWWVARKMRVLLVIGFGEERYRRIRAVSTVIFVAVLASYGFAIPVGPAESNLIAFGFYAASLSSPDEMVLTLTPRTSTYRKIVLLMDESVRADVFQSEVAERLPRGAVDLGTALSTSTCSASSNAAMRWGILRSDIGSANDLRSHPTLWQFAKHAGFRTVFVDNQSTGKHQNFLLPKELSLIDEFIPGQAGIETDRRFGQALRERLKTKDKEFIYVVMRGSHFPYSRNLPSTKDTIGLSRLAGYGLSVAYATGGLLSQLDAQEFHSADVLLLYTSDHGQLFANGSTHCSGEYRIDEYLVPMVVMGGGSLVDDVRSSKSCNLNRSDHQELRSTALLAMGYLWSDLERNSYFPPLTICNSDEKAARLLDKLPWVTANGDRLKLTVWDGAPRLPTTSPP